MALLSTRSGRFKLLETKVREISSRDPAVQAIQELFITISKVNERGLYQDLIPDLEILQDSIDMCRIYDNKNHSPIRTAVYAMVEGTKCILATLKERHSKQEKLKQTVAADFVEERVEPDAVMKEEEVLVKEEEAEVTVKEEELENPVKEKESSDHIRDMNPILFDEVKEEPIDPEDPEIDPLPGTSMNDDKGDVEPKEEIPDIWNIPPFMEDPQEIKDEEMNEFSTPLVDSWQPSTSNADHGGYSSRDAIAASRPTLMTTRNGSSSPVVWRPVRREPRTTVVMKYQCTVGSCRKAFASQEFLDKHKNEHLESRPNPSLGVARCSCPKCPKAFLTAHFLRQHMKEEHVCPKGCGAVLKSRPYVKRHLKNYHGKKE